MAEPAVAADEPTTTPARPAPAIGLGLTQRAVALVVVLAVLALSYVSSLRIWIDQEQQMAAARAQINRDQLAIDRLNDEIARWQDPAYVRAQARDRLGWVMPGEVGYRVVGPDGKVVGGQVGSIEGPDDTSGQAWYERLQGSVQTADQPAPTATTPTPQAQQTVTVAPSPTPTPSRR